MLDARAAERVNGQAVAAPAHHVYLIPGMFGFGRLAGYDYFEHVERALEERLRASGRDVHVAIVPTPPTASIRRRARVVAETVFETMGDAPTAHVHLVGHSTGGLDARLLASPDVNLTIPKKTLAWTEQVRTVITMNTPHYGTPLASFFATVSGTRLLYALSLLTFTTLRYGGPPLTVFSTLVAAIGGLDEAIGIDVKLLDRATDLILRFIGDRGREEVHGWLDGIRQDQGGIIQLMPEAMDIFNAVCHDAEHVRYGSVVTASPPPVPLRLATRIRSPYAALTAAIYSTLYQVTSREHAGYPSPAAVGENLSVLESGVGREVTGSACDGIVPTLSMLWGKLLWAGRGDHLDIVGHFQDDEKPPVHIDWLWSGSSFTRRRFGDAMDSISRFILEDTE